MIIPVILFIIGLLCLIKGGDWFVDGAVGLARRFHIPDIIIGATIVSIGTTLPEVMVSATSAISGHGEIAYGNAVGSVICNTALIAAITIAVRPEKIDSKPLRIPTAFFFTAAVIYAATAYISGYFSRPLGLILLSIFAVYMVTTVKQAIKAPVVSENDTNDDSEIPLQKALVYLVLGAVLIAVGSDLLVDNGILIAAGMGVPESVIALTFVALGTSLPELVTAVVSLTKGHGNLSLGNIVGANLFNLVLVSGVSVTLSPFYIPQEVGIAGMNASLVIDIPVMFLVMLILTLPALIKNKLSRIQGIGLLVIYGVFSISHFLL